ncbi:DUF2198 family protein [bacterium LRH843]|nr:DUF2198 family protein [bacterium LRH843]
MSEVLLALIIPFLLMIVVTRIAFSLVGACIVTWMVGLFVLSFHEKPWFIGVIAILSFAAGLAIARKRLKHKPGM